MVKIYFTYGKDKKEEFDSLIPLTSQHLEHESVDEIEGSVIHQVKDLAAFIEECYRLLKKGGKATFTAPRYTHNLAWTSPLTVRAICEESLHFASKEWREVNKYSEIDLLCDFDIAVSFSIESSFMQRADDARGFMIKHYNNVVQALIFTLVKK